MMTEEKTADQLQIESLIKNLDTFIPDPKKGLPLDVFYFVSRMTPLVNVDLLIKNEKNETLLTWRHDQFYHGWHIAGGILRFKETFADRLNAVAKAEFGVQIEFDSEPVVVQEKILPTRDVRGHFISFLYRCRLLSALDEKLKCSDPEAPKHGQWMWHKGSPRQLIPPHEAFRKYIEA